MLDQDALAIQREGVRDALNIRPSFVSAGLLQRILDGEVSWSNPQFPHAIVAAALVLLSTGQPLNADQLRALSEAWERV